MIRTELRRGVILFTMLLLRMLSIINYAVLLRLRVVEELLFCGLMAGIDQDRWTAPVTVI